VKLLSFLVGRYSSYPVGCIAVAGPAGAESEVVVYGFKGGPTSAGGDYNGGVAVSVTP
jgi:hypothetical protein